MKVVTYFWGQILACLLLIIAGGLPAAAEAPNIFAAVQEQTLDNGLKVLLLPEPRAPVVSVQVWYRVGARNETLGQTGLSHLLEHLMFRGTEKYGPKVFSRLVQQVGGNDNAFTSKDYTAYFENGPKDQLKLFLELEADRMRHLKISEELFQTERQVVLEERRLRTEDDPINSLYEETVATAYKAHSYQWPVIGWFQDIKNLTRTDLQSYYDRYYQPNNATLVIVGDIDPEAAMALVKETFGRIPAGPAPPPFLPFEPEQQGERRTQLVREAQLPAIFMAYHVPNLEHQDAYALEVLSLILAAGRSSRLPRQLVYDRKLALDAGADYESATASPSLFLIYAQPLPGQPVAVVEQALEKEIRKLQDQPVTEEELAKAKNQAEAAFVKAQDSLFYRGMLLGRYQTLGDWRRLNQIIPAIRAVTKEAVQQAAKTYLVPRNRTVGVLVPQKPSRPTRERFTPHEAIR